MTTIRKEISTLKTLAKQIAASQGKPGILATQEVQAAFKGGKITKAQRDVLQRALADSTPDLKSVQQHLASYGAVFAQGDVNQNGRSEKSEQKAWNAAHDAWMWKAVSPRRDPVEVAALKAKTLQLKTVRSDGKELSSPIYGAGTLLKKLDALLANQAAQGA